MEVGKKIIDDIKDTLRSNGPTLDVKRGKDGAIQGLTLTGATPHCGAPSSVSVRFTTDKNGNRQISVTAKDGFINPQEFGRDRPQAPTNSQLNWLKDSIMKNPQLSEAEKAMLVIELSTVTPRSEHGPEFTPPGKLGPEYIDDPSKIRKLMGKEEVHYAEMQVFPDTSLKKRT